MIPGSIKRILDGCIVEENFSGGEFMHLRGRSVSVFDARAGKWKQTWVDNEGGYLDFVGDFTDGQMTLAREAIRPDGTRVKQRIVFKNITPQRFRLELGAIAGRRENLAGGVADPLQEKIMNMT